PAELDERTAPVLAVNDDAVEAAEEPPPERRPVRGPPRQQVVRREDERRAGPEQPRVELRRADPLQVGYVGARGREPGQADWMLERLYRDPRSRRPDARRHRVEAFAYPVPVRPCDSAEAELRGQ